jgi:hypothetical protein
MSSLPSVTANQNFDGPEWDKELSSTTGAEHSDNINHTLSHLELDLDQETAPALLMLTEDNQGESEDPEQLDITDAGSQDNSVDDIAYRDSTELLLHDTGLVPIATQRTSTIDLDTMEQGSLASILRRRTVLPRQDQVRPPSTILKSML